MIELRLPPAVAAAIEEAARRAFPRECCGLFEGVSDRDFYRVLALHPTPNIAAASDRFEIDPAAHFAVLRAAREKGHAIIGCYHSHPGGVPAPSPTDRAGAGEIGFVWLIAALANPQAPIRIKAFVYGDQGFSEIGWATGADLVTSSSKTLSRSP